MPGRMSPGVVNSNIGAPTRTLLFVFGIVPNKLGGLELFAAELSRQVRALGGWRLVFCFEAKPAKVVLAALDHPHVTLEVIEEQSAKSLRGALQFVQIVRRHRPEVVVYAFNGVLRSYPWLSRLFSSARVVYNDRCSRVTPCDASFVKRVLARAITLPVDEVIGVSHYVRRAMQASGFVAPARVHVIYNGVDLHASDDALEQERAFRARYAIPEGRALVLQVSWMTAEKGVDKLLQAARRVIDRVPHAHFVLVGTGGALPSYQDLARRLEIADHVTWTGAMEQPTAEGAFAAASVCCLMSQWDEAFGVAIAEAMAFGKPVVATRVGGIPELVEDGRTGFVVGRDDVPAMADRIVALLEDGALRARLGREARRVAAQKFDLRKTVALYLQHLAVVGEERRHPAEAAPDDADTDLAAE